MNHQDGEHGQRLQRARAVFEQAERLAREPASVQRRARADVGPGSRDVVPRADAPAAGAAGEPPAVGPGAGESGASRLTADEPVERARTIALNMLNHSARSRGELAEAMARKEVPADVAEQVLDRFEQVGLINDTEYAAMLVRTRQSERGLARRALAVELRRKGIVGEAAAEALGAVGPDDEEAAARRVVDKRLRAMPGLAAEVKRRRLVAMLARKGHPAGLSYRVVDEALAAQERS